MFKALVFFWLLTDRGQGKQSPLHYEGIPSIPPLRASLIPHGSARDSKFVKDPWSVSQEDDVPPRYLGSSHTQDFPSWPFYVVAAVGSMARPVTICEVSGLLMDVTRYSPDTE